MGNATRSLLTQSVNPSALLELRKILKHRPSLMPLPLTSYCVPESVAIIPGIVFWILDAQLYVVYHTVTVLVVTVLVMVDAVTVPDV